MDLTLEAAAAAARACTRCADLPLGPRPVFRVSPTARLLVIGQAPGTRVHATGIPWNDPSGDRLRDWLGMDRDAFYDVTRIAIVPTGLCYPGRLPRGGDAPPRPECAPLWHPRLIGPMRARRLTLLVGSHAIRSVLGRAAAAQLGETVRNFATCLPRGYFPLPHPSWRTRSWAADRPWFAAEALPALRRAVTAALDG
ncbi:uracil-DNA glycosylase family protein [Roseomonas sp. E05]|uniref:uracil-DNA glycosylase family protein n=1 Tax=Roseomonas sp. E05 TaxID=3046310 RepID=UPI0024BB191C|nr:uracil-DNA glycosylase family protein [Roseomonas sp. E05]MDJ0386494.1 uracil-DNA glycosylase family protein [Roseomonas sp. E05]